MGEQKKTTAKTYTVKVSLNALQNIDEITGYITFINQQPLNAIKVGDVLLATIGRIAANPFLLRQYEEIPTRGKIYRKATCHSWSVIIELKPANNHFRYHSWFPSPIQNQEAQKNKISQSFAFLKC